MQAVCTPSMGSETLLVVEIMGGVPGDGVATPWDGTGPLARVCSWVEGIDCVCPHVQVSALLPQQLAAQLLACGERAVVRNVYALSGIRTFWPPAPQALECPDLPRMHMHCGLVCCRFLASVVC